VLSDAERERSVARRAVAGDRRPAGVERGDRGAGDGDAVLVPDVANQELVGTSGSRDRDDRNESEGGFQETFTVPR
jgi:hypothetical protein